MTTIRLSKEGRALLEALKERRGINGTALIETLIREAAKREGVKSES